MGMAREGCTVMVIFMLGLKGVISFRKDNSCKKVAH